MHIRHRVGKMTSADVGMSATRQPIFGKSTPITTYRGGPAIADFRGGGRLYCAFTPPISQKGGDHHVGQKSPSVENQPEGVKLEPRRWRNIKKRKSTPCTKLGKWW